MFDSTDQMLVDRLSGRYRRDPRPISYDARTGRFVLLLDVFAAFAMGRGTRDPGPFQTGPAEVWFEADAARPLRVLLFDEMPDVRITLAVAEATAATHPTGPGGPQRASHRSVEPRNTRE